MLRAILDQGSDVRVFGRQYDSQLRSAELESIQDYILESDNLQLLHSQVRCTRAPAGNAQRPWLVPWQAGGLWRQIWADGNAAAAVGSMCPLLDPSLHHLAALHTALMDVTGPQNGLKCR